MKEKVDLIGESLKETLLEIMHNNNNKLESKLNEVVNLQKSYASIVKGPQVSILKSCILTLTNF